MTALKWEAPAAPNGSNGTRSSYSALLAEVAQRPGHWALLSTFKRDMARYGNSTTTRDATRAHAVARQIRNSAYFSEFPAMEVVARRTRSGDYGVFARQAAAAEAPQPAPAKRPATRGSRRSTVLTPTLGDRGRVDWARTLTAAATGLEPGQHVDVVYADTGARYTSGSVAVTKAHAAASMLRRVYASRLTRLNVSVTAFPDAEGNGVLRFKKRLG